VIEATWIGNTPAPPRQAEADDPGDDRVEEITSGRTNLSTRDVQATHEDRRRDRPSRALEREWRHESDGFLADHPERRKREL